MSKNFCPSLYTLCCQLRWLDTNLSTVMWIFMDVPWLRMCNTSTFLLTWASCSCLTNNVSWSGMSPAVLSRPYSPALTHSKVWICTHSSSHGTSCVAWRGCIPTLFRTWTGVVIFPKGQMHASVSRLSVAVGNTVDLLQPLAKCLRVGSP